MVDTLIWFVPIAGLIAVAFAVYLARDVLGRDKGTPEMQAVASTIFEGAMAFLRRQYTTIAILALVTAVLVAGVIYFIPRSTTGTAGDCPTLGILTRLPLFLGAAAPAPSGLIRVYVAG